MSRHLHRQHGLECVRMEMEEEHTVGMVSPIVFDSVIVHRRDKRHPPVADENASSPSLIRITYEESPNMEPLSSASSWLSS